MHIDLTVRLHTQRTREEFIAEAPDGSIAIDGYVPAGRAEVFRAGDRWLGIVDHHVGDRGVMMTSCEQVFEGLRNGLFLPFQRKEKTYINLHINSPDEDTCLSYSLLRHWKEIIAHPRSLAHARMLQYYEGKMDRTVGIYKILEQPRLEELTWLFEPYQRVRYSQGTNLSPQDASDILEEVDRRFVRSLEDPLANRLAPWGEQRTLGTGDGWRIVSETGPASRIKMVEDRERHGIELYALYLGTRPAGGHDWTLIASFPFVNIHGLEEILNGAEGEAANAHNRWGGNYTLKASPRETGSVIDPAMMGRLLAKEFKPVFFR